MVAARAPAASSDRVRDRERTGGDGGGDRGARTGGRASTGQASEAGRRRAAGRGRPPTSATGLGRVDAAMPAGVGTAGGDSGCPLTSAAFKTSAGLPTASEPAQTWSRAPGRRRAAAWYAVCMAKRASSSSESSA